MSGTSARESYRTGKRTRLSDGQANHLTPPVLFRLPAVAPPIDEAANASSMNSVGGAMAMAMPTASSSPTMAVAPTSISTSPAVPASTATATPTQNAAATISAEKAAGQRMLNMLIIVLLLTALAVITWISINGSSSGSAMATKPVGNDAALDTLGNLTVPDVTQGTPAESSRASETKEQAPNAKPDNSADVAASATPKPEADDAAKADAPNNGPGSLMLGLDMSGSSSDTNSSANASPQAASTAQIQLRAPVPMGGSTASSLVDAQRSSSSALAGSLSSSAASLGGSSSPSFETVSTPSQNGKIFPASSDPTKAGTETKNPSSSGSSDSSGKSPTLYDEARRLAPEGLQLSNRTPTSQPTVAGEATQVNVSQPLSSVIDVAGTQTGTQSGTQLAGTPSTTSNSSSSPAATDAKRGVTVGAGVPEPYQLNDARVSESFKNLSSQRPDLKLDTDTLVQLGAQGVARSGSTTPSATLKINSYAGNTTPVAPGTNLYQTNSNFVNPAPSGSPINSYARNVPSGVTGQPAGAYVPTTTTSSAGQNPATGFPNPQAQFASGPTSVPAAPAGFQVPPRGPAVNGQPYQPQTFQQPGYQQNYAQPNYSQPNYPQQNNQPPTYPPQSYQQPGTGYGANSGSGFANPAYIPPNSFNPNMNMGATAQQSYPNSGRPMTGQQPLGPIGAMGYATPPINEVAPIPVTGRMGVGYTAPYGAPQ